MSFGPVLVWVVYVMTATGRVEAGDSLHFATMGECFAAVPAIARRHQSPVTCGTKTVFELRFEFAVPPEEPK